MKADLKWRDKAKKILDAKDEIQKSYSGRLDGEYGHLTFSNKKIQFFREKGFLHKTYDLILDLPYELIGKIDHKSKHEMELVAADGAKYKFFVEGISISIVENSLKDLKA